MPPKKQPFSTDQEFLLIHSVKNRPPLWDVSHSMYKRTDIKETLWEEVGNLVGVTAEVARERFINMRTTFMKNERRMRESKQKCSGKGTEEIYKPKWSLYTSLLFLKKSCVQTESSSNLENDDSQTLIIDANEEKNNNLAHSINQNLHFDENTQKWILLSSNVDESSYSQTSCEDSSTDFNKPLLEHTYSADTDDIQQSYIKRNRLSTHSSVSDYDNFSLNETDESPCTSSLLSERASSPKLTAVKKNKNKIGEDSVFVKRGSRKKSSIMEEAVEALKKISNDKMPHISQSPLRTSNTDDACEHLGLFIAARLRAMEPDVRLRCELEIMTILNTATIETQEKYSL